MLLLTWPMHEACQVLLQLIGYVDVPVACQVSDGLQQVLESGLLGQSHATSRTDHWPSEAHVVREVISDGLCLTRSGSLVVSFDQCTSAPARLALSINLCMSIRQAELLPTSSSEHMAQA